MQHTFGDTLIDAVSVGGLETCIQVPRWKLCFDIGRCPPDAVRLSKVLFTHAHLDHMGGVAAHCATRSLWGMKPPTYCVPANYAEDLEALLAAWRRLDGAELPCTILPVEPGQSIPVGQNRHAVAFRSHHVAPCIGYALCSTRSKLKERYRGLPGPTLRDLRLGGEAITDEVVTPEVAFCGDTTIDVVERQEIVRKARVLVLEVTFLDERVSVAKARRHGHIHLDEVIERADLFENEHLLFTHFSSRYHREEIARILDERLPDSLRERAVPLLPEPPWSRHDGAAER